MRTVDSFTFQVQNKDFSTCRWLKISRFSNPFAYDALNNDSEAHLDLQYESRSKQNNDRRLIRSQIVEFSLENTLSH